MSDGRLNGPEFEDYYTFIGFQIQNDQYFTTLISNVWRIPEKQEKYDRKSRGDQKSNVDPELVRQYPKVLLLIPQGKLPPFSQDSDKDSLSEAQEASLVSPSSSLVPILKKEAYLRAHSSSRH